MKEILSLARPGQFALGAFHAANLEQAQAVLAAAVETRSPAIIALDESAAIYAGLGPFIVMARELSRELPTPVTVQLDHVHDLDLIAKALAFGVGAVLYDPRDDVGDEAVERMTAAREWCAKAGTWFELELRDGRRSADETVALWRGQRPDCACLSVTAEEREKPSEELLALCQRLRREGAWVAVAGAGAWSEADIRRTITAGAWKISVGTRLNQAFTDGLRDYLQGYSGIHPRAYLGAARDAERREAAACIRAFGSEGSA